MPPPVVNASPLIFLTKADLLFLLRASVGPVVVPEAVAREIQARGPADVTAHALGHTDWLRIVPAVPVPIAIAAWDLGPGESAVLAHAHAHPGTVAVVDDRAARRCAAVLGVRVRGTLGLVLAAKQAGRIAAARPLVARLVETGMYLSPHTIQEALKLVGE